MLAVADLHWGKTESFQQHGIPLPAGVLEDDLARLSAALAATGARRLLLRGGPRPLAPGAHPRRRRRASPPGASRPCHVEMVLVRGNHDRHVETLPPAWRHGGPRGAPGRGPLPLRPPPGARAGPLRLGRATSTPWCACPAGADRLRLPCFHLGPEVGVLPAFSAFTGGLDVTPRARASASSPSPSTAVVEV